MFDSLPSSGLSERWRGRGCGGQAGVFFMNLACQGLFFEFQVPVTEPDAHLGFAMI